MGWNRCAMQAVVAAGVLTVWAAPVLAGSASVVISPGAGLTVAPPAVSDFAVMTGRGAHRSVEAGFGSFTVTDSRGTGDGWTVTIQATPLRAWDGTGYAPGHASLPAAGSLTFPGVAVAPDGTDSPAPVTTTGPYPLDGTALTVAHATAGTGMGRYAFTPMAALRVTVPADAPAGTYRSEISVSVNSGP